MAETRTTSKSVLDAIGNTPLVPLQKVVPPGGAQVLLKLEYFNPTGSYKDRMALGPGMCVVEYTGGSTGSSLAFVCAAKGYRFKVVSSDAFSIEKLRTMEALGAELTLVPSVGGKITPDLIPRMMDKARDIAAQEPSYWTNQLHNTDSIKGYEEIGRELAAQAPELDVFCGAVGTAGMLMGVARALREAGSRARIVALEPKTSAALTGGSVGAHGVEGIAIGKPPPLLDSDFYDEARAVNEDEARAVARRLAREEGIFTGISSGLNVAADLAIQRRRGKGVQYGTPAESRRPLHSPG